MAEYDENAGKSDTREPRYPEPVQIPFETDIEGVKVEGLLVPVGKLLPFGVPSAFDVFMKGCPAFTISIERGYWVMEGAPVAFTEAIGEWIGIYYEEKTD